MKILWIISFPLPEVSHLAGVEKNAFGGWVGTMLHRLAKVEGFSFYVAMKSPVDKIIYEEINGIHYYLIPQSKEDRFDVYQNDCEEILQRVSPDILHSEGTEGAFTQRFFKTWKGKNSVSLQGILNGYEPYEYGDLPVADMLFSFRFREMLIAMVLMSNKFLFFKKRMKKERETISLANNIIGRTTWDHSHAYAINPRATYHHCHHILRDTFYKTVWSMEEKEEHSIFVGNAAAPRKGAHFLLHAVAQLKEEFPNIRLYIAGEKPKKRHKWDWKRVVGYTAYINYLIDKLEIEKHIHFTGVLQAEELAERMAKCHLFVLPSVIENSPTTLSEAMIMGVPSISSFVGGVQDMAVDGEEALFYRDNDPAMLAYQIKRLFDDDVLAKKLSVNARKRALHDHDPQMNVDRMVHIYSGIIQDEKTMIEGK